MELQQWLDRFGWNTSCRVTRLEWTPESGLLVELDAYPFWLDRPVTTERGRLAIRLRQVVESSIDLDWDPMEFDLNVATDDPLLWHYGEFASVYARSPMPDPATFLAAYWAHCVGLGVMRDGLHYLNAENGIEGWFDVVRSPSYVLFCGPSKIAEFVEELLARQHVGCSVMNGPAPHHEWARLVVWLDRSWVVCGDADIEASDPQ